MIRASFQHFKNTPLSLSLIPSRLSKTRSVYDIVAQRIAHKVQRKLEYTQSHPENISFASAMEIFRTYTLGQDLPLTLQIEVTEASAGGQGKTLKSDVILPHAVKSDAVLRILCLTNEVKKATEMGAHAVGGEEMIAKMDKEFFESMKIDRILCSTALFPKVVRIAKLLGPLGLMPSPSKGTVGDDLGVMMRSLQSSTLFESDVDRCIHIDAARSCWDDAKIEQNFIAIFKAVEKSAKGKGKSGTTIVGVHMSAAPFTPGIQMPTKNMLDKIKHLNDELEE